MSSWRIKEEPMDFLEILYGEEEGDGNGNEEEMIGDESEFIGDEDEEALFQSASLDRSRSPIEFRSTSESASEDVDDDDDDLFLSSNSHVRYPCPEDRVRIGRNGRKRGVRAGRGCGRKLINQDRGRGNQWEVGHPLHEIWPNDKDIPPELSSQAKEAVRRRIRAPEQRDIASESEEDDDSFFDASDGTGCLHRPARRFEWSPMETFEGREEKFSQESTGSVDVFNSAYDAFRSYWGDDILGLIVTETNQYASKIVSNAFQSEWYPTNTHEILCLFTFWVMLEIIKMPTITSCFSADPLLKTEVFRRIFTRRRYEMLTRTLNYLDSGPALNDANSSNHSAAGSLDEIQHLKPIITHLNSKFQSNYVLEKDICINESLALWNGKLNFEQYIRSKAAKFGIKTFELSESATGYLWAFTIFSRKLSSRPGVVKNAAIVKKLIGPLLNKGHRLFMDSWYNSPLLARYLKFNKTDCVGTLSTSSKNVPFIIDKAPLKRGEIIARHSGDVCVLSWQDIKRITMISTCHGSSTALPVVASRLTSRPVPFKPQMVLDYNKFIRGLHFKEQMIEPYLLERKHQDKMYMKLFKRLLNVSILNSRILLQSSTQKHHDHLDFRLQLVDSILKNHLSRCPQSRKFIVSSSRSSHQQPGIHVISTHWPVLLEATESCLARNRRFWKRCVVCLREGRKTQRTSYCCESCRVPLCIKNCFKTYHTSQ